MIRMRFIGKDGSMGLTHGRIYEVSIYTFRSYIWVNWVCNQCPYDSLEKLSENWESTR